MRNLTVNGERLWASLMELAQIGATAKGGVCRLAASDLDAEARRLTDLGATFTGALSADGLDHYAVGMKDPEGNEFDIN